MAHIRLAVGKTAQPRKSSGWRAHNWGISGGSVLASLLVGTILTLVNQGDLLFTGRLPLSLAWMIAMNYVMALALAVISGPMTGADGQHPLLFRSI